MRILERSCRLHEMTCSRPSPAGPIAQRLEQPRTPSGLVAGANPRIGLPFAGGISQRTITIRAYGSAVSVEPNAFGVGRRCESSNWLAVWNRSGGGERHGRV